MSASPPRPDLVQPEQLPIPFGRYDLLRLLGEGGMGRVFVAELQGLEGFRKQVALKVIKAGPLTRSPDTATQLHYMSVNVK